MPPTTESPTSPETAVGNQPAASKAGFSPAPSTANPRPRAGTLGAGMSVGDPDNLAESEMQPGAVWEYVQGDFDTLPDFAHLAPNATGLSENVSIDGESEISLFQQSANFRPDDTQALGDFGVRFSGFLKIPQDGTWTFFLTSNDGARLYLSGRAIVDNDGLHYSTEKQGRATLKAGIHPLTVLYFHRNGKMLEGIRVGPQLSLAWYLPGSFSLLGGTGSRGVPKQIVPANFILHNPHDVTTQHLLTSGGDRAQEPPIPPSVAKRIKILENALEEQDQRLESMRLAFERIRGIHLFENSKKAIPMDDREDAYTIRDTVGGETVDGRRTVDGNEADEAVAIVVGGGQRELDDIIDSHVGEVERLKELYFFHLALQIKVRAHAAYPARAARRGEPQSDRTQPPLVSLQDLWEEFHEQKVPVDKWASKISAKFGMKKKEK